MDGLGRTECRVDGLGWVEKVDEVGRIENKWDEWNGKDTESGGWKDWEQQRESGEKRHLNRKP